MKIKITTDAITFEYEGEPVTIGTYVRWEPPKLEELIKQALAMDEQVRVRKMVTKGEES